MPGSEVDACFESIIICPNLINKDEFTIYSPFFMINSIDVYNALGKFISHSTVNSKQKTLNLNEVNGIYFLRVETSNGISSKKIILIQ